LNIIPQFYKIDYMGYAGKLRERDLAIQLRAQGLSIGAIKLKLGVSKSSVSIWTRDVKLSYAQKRKLYLNSRTGQLRGSIIAAENKKRRRELEEKTLLAIGKKEVGRLTKRNFFIAGISLYFAEGDKQGDSIGFSNSDPRAILFMMKWFRKFLKVPEDKYRAYLYIHDNLNQRKAKKYWSKLTGISLKKFGKGYIVKNDKNRLRKVKHQYGVLRITISDVKLLRRMLGWIAGVLES